MTIKHILADGRETDTIAGHVVKGQDAKFVYELIARMNREGAKHEKEISKNAFDV